MVKAGRGALILAGGKSKRIGTSKAFIDLNGKPMLLYVVDKVQEIADEIVVAVEKDSDPSSYVRILPPSILVVNDFMVNVGPLAGILVGMSNLSAEYGVVLPCDVPFVNVDVLKLLFDRASGAEAAIPQWPNGYIEPLHAVYRVESALQATRSALKEVKQRVYEMIRRLRGIVYVDVEEIKRIDPNLLTFFNVNSYDDLSRAKLLLNSCR
jgi:molybdopterin-guanine dinucleotide biosynthesis protein A